MVKPASTINNPEPLRRLKPPHQLDEVNVTTYTNETRRSRRIRRNRRATLRSTLIEISVTFVLAILISLFIKHFLVQNFEIPTGSMLNTIEIGDRIAVNRLVPTVRDIKRGDIVVFKDSQQWLGSERRVELSFYQRVLVSIGLAPENSNNHLVKRVIGLPGDSVKCCSADGKLVVNGVAITEPYIRSGAEPSTIKFDVKVPSGHIWVMGDNRSGSADSRFHMDTPGKGFVPISDVVGRAFLRWWPISHFGNLEGTNAFSSVPNPK